MKTVYLMTCAAVAGLATCSTAHAGGLTLGKNHVLPEFGIGRFGDQELDDIFGAYYGAGATANFNLAPHLDLQVGGAYVWAGGDRAGVDYDVDQRSGGFALIGYPDPIGQLTPYVFGTVGRFDAKWKARGPDDSVTEEDSDETYGGGAGVQFEVTPKVLIDVSADYTRSGGSDNWDGNVEFGYWFTDRVLTLVSGSYDFDSEDVTDSIGLLFRF